MWTPILLKYLRICLQPSLTSSPTHSLTTLANDILLIPEVARSHPPKGFCIWCSLTWNSLSLNSLPVISPNSLCLALNLSNYLDFLYHITIFGYPPALIIWYSLLVYLLINFLPFTIRMKAPDHGESYLSFNHFITRAYKTAWHLKRNSMFLNKKYNNSDFRSSLMWKKASILPKVYLNISDCFRLCSWKFTVNMKYLLFLPKQTRFKWLSFYVGLDCCS